MLTARFAVGSVSTLALSAVLFVGASFWLNRTSAAQHGTPWGDLSSLSSRTAAAPQADDRAELLKLAALKSSGDAPSSSADVPAATSTPAASVQPSTAPATVATPVNPPVPDGGSPADASVATAAPTSEPVQMASAEIPAAPAAAATAEDAPVPKSSAVNLNTATAEVLDHVGAGRIGRTIVAHRPYRSVKDLVNRRVLRTSDYEKIEARVRVE